MDADSEMFYEDDQEEVNWLDHHLGKVTPSKQSHKPSLMVFRKQSVIESFLKAEISSRDRR
jgi:hypothetical protein